MLGVVVWYGSGAHLCWERSFGMEEALVGGVRSVGPGPARSVRSAPPGPVRLARSGPPGPSVRPGPSGPARPVRPVRSVRSLRSARSARSGPARSLRSARSVRHGPVRPGPGEGGRRGIQLFRSSQSGVCVCVSVSVSVCACVSSDPARPFRSGRGERGRAALWPRASRMLVEVWESYSSSLGVAGSARGGLHIWSFPMLQRGVETTRDE